MKKLTKAQIAKKAEILKRLQDADSELEASIAKFNDERSLAWDVFSKALEEYNQTVRNAWGDVETQQAELNSAISDANDFMQEIADEIGSAFDDKSERWQDSDAGQAVSDWKSTWEDQLDDVSMDEPEDVEAEEPDELVYEIDGVEKFENLPDGADA